MDGNFWWNGPHPLPSEGCSPLPEGPNSTVPRQAPFTAPPLAATDIDGTSVASTAASALNALQADTGSQLAGRAVSDELLGSTDRIGAPRNRTIGALGANPSSTSQADRVFNWAERYYPTFFPASASQAVANFYLRAYPATGNYLGATNGRLLYLGPISDNQVLDLGRVSDWLAIAQQAGF